MAGRYIFGNSNDFSEFIDSISPKEKIGIVTHIDLDGIASGIFLQKIIESKGLKTDFIEFFDYNLKSINKILEKSFHVLFFTDWNIDNFPNELDILREEGRVFVIDHHPPNPSLANKQGIIKTESNYCSSQCLFDIAKERNYFDAKELEWLVCSSMIMDYTFNSEENIKFLKSIYPKLSEKDIWASEPAIIGNKIANALLYYKPDCKKVYELVLKKDLISLDGISDEIEKEIEDGEKRYLKEAEYFPSQNLYFGYLTTKHKMASPIVTRLSGRFDKTLIMVSDSEEKGIVKFSARNQTGKVDLNQVLKKCIKGFKDATAGGHIRASGGSFPKNYINEFKERLLKEL
ncbi:DHHA1 domain protein [uncultured archaeon]|nr:DHHA1 domain protein [uncultured archaeon]